jgi:biopolymer transport protein ExbD
MSLRSRNKVNVNFNMSSMTDLVFLLLIFFMILSTLAKSVNVIPVTLPKSQSKAISDGKARVTLTSDLRYYVDNVETGKEGVSAELAKLLSNVEDPKVEIAVDEDVEHKYFVELADIVSVQGGYRMVLVTKPPTN